MSQILIDCPRCSEATHVDMEQSLTGQRCKRCGSFLYSADTGVPLETETRKTRRKQWHSITGTVAHALQGETIDTTDAFQRRGWQAWYVPTFLAALICMLAVITYLVKRQRAEGRSGDVADQGLVTQPSLHKSADNRPYLAITSSRTGPSTVSKEWTTEVTKISQQFLSATTAEAILPLVRNREQVAESVTAYAAQPGHLPISKAEILAVEDAAEEGAKPGTLALLRFENNQDRVQGLVLTETPEGMRVDWPSFTGEGAMSISDFLTQKPTEPTLLRVAGRLDDYYNFEFQDLNLFTCLRLTDYPETRYFYGYVSTVTPMRDKVKNLPLHDRNTHEQLQPPPRPLTIKARFHAGTKSDNQVEITEILGNGWFVR